MGLKNVIILVPGFGATLLAVSSNTGAAEAVVKGIGA